MKPVDFPEMNTKFIAPGCGDLPAHCTSQQIVSCWELSDEERKQIADGGKLWLVVHSGFQPPVALLASCPIASKDEWPEEIEASPGKES